MAGASTPACASVARRPHSGCGPGHDRVRDFLIPSIITSQTAALGFRSAYADTHWLLASRFPHIRWNRTGSDELLKRARVDRFDQISVKPCNLGPSAVLALRITGHRDQPGGSACRG
jgi:hypothetical protein